MYSQYNEEQIITNYFGNYVGTFLDLGAYDGKDLSNTYSLMLKGWVGVCVEPHPDIFPRLVENTKNFNVQCLKFAIGTSNGKSMMNANSTYYSSLSDEEILRWNGKYSFNKIEVDVIDFPTLLDYCLEKNFDFISIDCEGLDFQILTQIDLSKVNCKLICVETNGKETEKYEKYISNFGFKKIALNSVNLIMGK